MTKRPDRNVPNSWRRGPCQDIKQPCAKGRLVSGKLPGGGAGVNPWWDPNGEGLCIWAAYQPRWAASLAASYLDLSGNGNNTGPGVAPTWDAVNGWKFNGVNQYLTTTFVPQNDQSQSMIMQYTNSVNAGYACGCTSGGNNQFEIRPTVAIWVDYGNGNRQLFSPVQVAGNLCVAGNQGYRNGVADGPLIAGWAGVPGPAVAIGCWNNPGPVTFWQGYIQAFALYDCTLTAPQVLAVATAMAVI